MIFYAHNPDISYEIIVPKGKMPAGILAGFWAVKIESITINWGVNALFFYGYALWLLALCHSKQTSIFLVDLDLFL